MELFTTNYYTLTDLALWGLLLFLLGATIKIKPKTKSKRKGEQKHERL